MIKFDKNEFLKPQIYSTLDEYETRCNVTKEIIEEIEQLQQENKKLNGTIQTYDILLKSNIEENKQLKEVIDKAIDNIDLVIELIKQQPTEDDSWILDRLNTFKIILKDKEVSE